MAGAINMGDYWESKSQVDSLADLEAGIEAATITGIDVSNVSSTTSVVTISASSPGSPKAGDLWLDTSALTSAPAQRLKVYDGVTSAWLGTAVTYSTTAPTTTEPGRLWYDLTLYMLRVYRDATTDAGITGLTGKTGWHPVSNAYQLWKNASGSATVAGSIVIDDALGSDDTRVFDMVSVEKHQGVIGIAMEVIADGSYGVIAMNSGGVVVDVFVDADDALGAVARGDGIVTSSNATVGRGRTVGPLGATGHPAATTLSYGTPAGCFAVALKAKASGAGVVPCRLLGYVGTGCTRFTLKQDIWNDTVPPTAFTEIDASATDAGAGDGTQDAANSALASAKHAPLLAVEMGLTAEGTTGSSSTIAMHVSKDGTSDNAKAQFAKGGITSVDDFADIYMLGFVPTGVTSGGATIGSMVNVKTAATGGAITWSKLALFITKYIY